VRAIYRELGEHDERSIEIDEYQRRIKRAACQGANEEL